MLDLLLGELRDLTDENASLKSSRRLSAVTYFAQNGRVLGGDPQFHSLANVNGQRDPNPRARDIHDRAVDRSSRSGEDLDFGLVISGITGLTPALGGVGPGSRGLEFLVVVGCGLQPLSRHAGNNPSRL